MKKRSPVVPALAALAALFLAPLAEASLARTAPPANEPPALTLASPAPEPSGFSLFDGHELARSENDHAQSFHPLAAVSLLSEDASLDLALEPEARYPKTRVWAIDVLGSTLVSRSSELSLESHWACGDFSCGLASGGRKDPLGLERVTPSGGVNPLADTLSEEDLSWWAILRDTAGNTLTDFLMLDTIAEKSAVVGDTTRSTGERVWAGTVGLGTAAFDVAGGEILGTAGKVVTRIPGVKNALAKVGESAVGRLLARDVRSLLPSEAAQAATPRGVNLARPKRLQSKPEGVEFGPPRGGGGDEAARAYAYQVTGGAEKAIYVNGVEFEGVANGVLIDAKRASAVGSFYDITGADAFTRNVRIPKILDQARRQLRAVRGTQFKGIRWEVADERVAAELQRLMQQQNLAIAVVPRAARP
jgi:hypothetical protein